MLDDAVFFVRNRNVLSLEFFYIIFGVGLERWAREDDEKKRKTLSLFTQSSRRSAL